MSCFNWCNMLNIVTALLVAHSAPNAVPAKELAPAIYQAAAKYGVDPVLLTKIVLVESLGVPGAYNAKTADHGLVQINEATRKAYGISLACVRNWRCNLLSASRILADMLKMDRSRPCMYNVGPRGRLPQYATACLRYEKKLDMVSL